ncbi:MAG: hypothetical protein ACRDJM_07435, partial [Actinomycetota bacterium]
MKKVRWTRRVTAAAALSAVALVVTGPGAGAAGVETYNAQASGTTLSASVTLPGVAQLTQILGNAG